MLQVSCTYEIENIIAAQSQVLMSMPASLTCDHFHSLPSTPWLLARNLHELAAWPVTNLSSSYLSIATNLSSPCKKLAETGESGKKNQTRIEYATVISPKNKKMICRLVSRHRAMEKSAYLVRLEMR